MIFLILGLLFLIDGLLIYSSTKKINRFRFAIFGFFVLLEAYYYSLGVDIHTYPSGVIYYYNCTEYGNWSTCSNATYPSQEYINEFVSYKVSQHEVIGFLSSISWIVLLLGFFVIIYDWARNNGYIRE